MLQKPAGMTRPDGSCIDFSLLAQPQLAFKTRPLPPPGHSLQPNPSVPPRLFFSFYRHVSRSLSIALGLHVPLSFGTNLFPPFLSSCLGLTSDASVTTSPRAIHFGSWAVAYPLRFYSLNSWANISLPFGFLLQHHLTLEV